MIPKQRLSASVDADLIRAAEVAVDEGRAGSVSAWVNDALRLKAEQDARVAALAEFVAAYEAKHGVIHADEMRAAAQRVRRRAIVASSLAGGKSSRASKRRAVA